MKKKQRVFFGFAVLLTAALFTMTACGGGAGGGGIATSLRFRDAPPPASLNRSVVGPSRAMMQGTTKDTASFSAIDAYYTGLGPKVDSITPTEFCFELMGAGTFTDGQVAGLIDGNPDTAQKIDFKNGASFTTTYGPEAGTTTTGVKIFFNLQDSRHHSEVYGKEDAARAKATFTIPANAATAIKGEAASWQGGPDQYYNQNGIYSISDTSITVAPQFLLKGLNNMTSLVFVYTGTQYKYSSDGTEGGFYADPGGAFVIPMNTIHIPGDASSITLTVSMDLTNIIEQYPNNKFVLAKDFWERLAIGATF